MKSHRGDGERILAVFIDFENVGLGFGNRRDRFNIEKVLERLVEKGKIVAKKAYADWSRFGQYAAALHAAAVELVEIPKRSQTGKNSADIRMCVDAMDLAYSKEHIDTFVIVSGDSDFSPLVSKLKELGKHVIGLGLADSTSDLLRDNCDEFIYYEDLDRVPTVQLVDQSALPEPKRKAFTLLLDSLLALRRENKEVIYSSMVKDTMKRKKPSFNEEYHGYRTFSELLEDAQRHGLIDLERHKSSGTYVVTRFGSEPRSSGTVATKLPLPALRAPTPAALPPAPSRPPGGSRETPREPRKEGGRRVAEPPPPPPPSRMPEEELPEELPLGRALMEDVDVLDIGEEDVPTYRPRKSPRSVEPPPPAKPVAAPPPPKPPAAPSPGRQPTPKPAPQQPGGGRRSTESGGRESGGRESGSRAQGGRRQEQARPPRKAPEKPAPPPPPPPPPDEDAEFGAGLNLD